MEWAEQLVQDRRSVLLVRTGRSKWTRVRKKRLLMVHLGLLSAVEFLENLMFVFGARYTTLGLGVPARQFGLAQAAYASACLLAIAAQQRLAHRSGYRKYLAASLGLFLLGTVIGGQSDSLSELIFARFLQGLGGGALFTSSRILVNLLFRNSEREKAARILVLCVFVTTAIAAPLASLLLSAFGWRALLYGVLPFGALALAGSCFLLPNAEPRTEKQRELFPFLVFASAVLVIQVFLVQLRTDLIAHPVRLAVIGTCAALLLFGFFFHQWHHPQPWVRLRPLRNGAFLMGLCAYFLYYLLSSFQGYLFPIFADKALGFTVVSTGALSGYAGTISLVALILYLRFAESIAYKKFLMVTGALLLSLASLWLAFLPPHTGVSAVMLGLTGKGLFGVLMALPIANLTFRELRDEHLAHGYQTKNMLRQLAMSFSSATAALLLDNREHAVKAQLLSELHPDDVVLNAVLERQALLVACHEMFLVLAALAAATALVLLVQRRLS